MKTRMALALVALSLLAGRAQAGNVDKAKLRKLVELPTVNVVVGINFSTTLGFSFNGDKPDPRVEIDQLRKQLKGDASDAERYQRLSLLYSKAGRDKESDAASAKAIALCRQQVKEHPDDMRWLALLGDALVSNGDMEEGEKLLRRAVKEAPDEWRAWLALGECVDILAIRTILGEKTFKLQLIDAKVMVPALMEKKPSPKQIAEMRRMWKEARRCYDRAVELAPRQTKPYFRRIGSNWLHGAVEEGLRAVAGKKVNLLAAFLSPECAADMNRIARLSPDDPKIVGSALLVEILTGLAQAKTKESKSVPSFEDFLAEQRRSPLDSLPAEKRKSARWSMERLEQLAKNADKATAAAASEILADVLMVMQRLEEDRRSPRLGSMMGTMSGAGYGGAPPPDVLSEEDGTAKILEHLNRAVGLDPSRDRAWDMLTMLLAEKKKTAEALAVARNRVQLKDNAHNRFLLAKLYADGDQFDKAAEQARAGLKNDPKDLDCRFTLIAALLKRDDAAALKEAGEQLDAVEAPMKEEKSKQRGLNYLLLRGIHAALSARPKQAKESFKQVLRGDKGHTRAARAIAALDEPLTPADRQLAIDYLRARKGEIEAADKRPDAPVGRVRLIDKGITDDDLFYLTAFSHLRELDLSGSSITDAGLAYVEELTSLQELNLDFTRITDKGFSRLQSLTNLRTLDINYTGITDTGLRHLKAFRNLERISLPGRPSIEQDKQVVTEAALSHLRKLSNLRDVSAYFSVSDKGLAHLAALPRLQYLCILDSKITDEGVRLLERCPELRELWISNRTLTDAALAHLKGLRHLRVLHLEHTKITDAGLIHLRGLTRLEILDLGGTAITDAGLAQLSGLTQLRELTLYALTEPETFGEKPSPAKDPAKQRITDAGLKHLRGLTKLKKLDLRGRPITDAGLAQLAEMKNLHQLLVGDTKVTSKGIAALRKAAPKLKIYR